MYNATSDETFISALRAAQGVSSAVALNTTPADDLLQEPLDAYISSDGLSGFAVCSDGELVGVFSLVKGRGAELMRHAVYRGAHYLDCFDGFLPRLYAAHGFLEVARFRNWNPGGPDVVHMALMTEMSEVYA